MNNISFGNWCMHACFVQIGHTMLNHSFVENCFISSFCKSKATNDVVALTQWTNLIYSCNHAHGRAAQDAYSQNTKLCVQKFKYIRLKYCTNYDFTETNNLNDYIRGLYFVCYSPSLPSPLYNWCGTNQSLKKYQTDSTWVYSVVPIKWWQGSVVFHA